MNKLEYPIPNTAKPRACKHGCSKPIYWTENDNGERIPVEHHPDKPGIGLLHYPYCLGGSGYVRKPKPKPEVIDADPLFE